MRKNEPARYDGELIENGSQNTTATSGRGVSGSRRRFIAASALIGAGAFGLGGPIGTAAADDHDDNGDDDGMDNGEEGEMNGAEGDIEILNFARTLELLEAEFYREGLDTIGVDGIRCSEVVQNLGTLQDRVFDDLRVIQEHEEIHADVLADTIVELGGEPVEGLEFDFGTATEDPLEFLALAAELEATGTAAYAGAAPEIQNADLIPPALSIHSVEARHTSFLNVLNDEIGFPDAFDEALAMDEVLEIAGQFIVE